MAFANGVNVPDWLTDLALPRTDGGVAIQVMVLIAAGVVGFASTNHHREARLVVIGLFLLALGLIGLRALH